MADNILVSGVGALNELKKEIRRYNADKVQLDTLKQSLSQLEKQLNSTTRELSDKIDKDVKKRRDDISSTYNKEISKEQEKLKEAKNEKSKAKEEKVKDRIKEETKVLNAENEKLKKEIKEAVAGANAPGYLTSNWYYALFMPKGAGQYIKLALITLVAFLVIPGLVCFLIPEDFRSIWVIVPVYGIIAVGMFALYNAIEKKTLVPYNSLLLSVRDAKLTIKKNKKKISKITKKIRRDKDEEMYELDTYEDNIKSKEVALENISDRKQEAINYFEKNTKQDIIDELNERYEPTIKKLNQDIENLKEQVSELDETVKEKGLYLTENYEAYIGKEFMKEEKIEELISIIKAGQANTVSLAIQVAKTRR